MVTRTITRSDAPTLVNPATDSLEAVQWWKRQIDKPLFVYFIQHGQDGPIKIGKAHNPVSRLSELQCGNPRPLTMRAVVVARDNTESELHRMWQFACMRGEWFGGGAELEILRLASHCQRSQIETWVDRGVAHITTLFPERIIRPTGCH